MEKEEIIRYRDLTFTLIRYMLMGKSAESQAIIKRMLTSNKFNRFEVANLLLKFCCGCIGPANPLLLFQINERLNLNNPVFDLTQEDYYDAIDMICQSKKCRLFDWTWAYAQIQSTADSGLEEIIMERQFKLILYKIQIFIEEKNFHQTCLLISDLFMFKANNSQYQISQKFFNRLKSEFNCPTIVSYFSDPSSQVWLPILSHTFNILKDQNMANAMCHLYNISLVRRHIYYFRKRENDIFAYQAAWMLCYHDMINFEPTKQIERNIEQSDELQIYAAEQINLSIKKGFVTFIVFDLDAENVDPRFVLEASEWRNLTIKHLKLTSTPH